MSERRPQDRTGDEAYILHTYPYRETSLLLDVFARAAGRMTLVARGARRPHSAMRGVLLSFQPVQLGWYGKGEVRTLTRAEWVGGQPLLRGEALLCGFYLNELLLRLLPREDPHEVLFDHYATALARLATEREQAPLPRGFERRLLQGLGDALALEREAGTGAPLDPDGLYRYDLERGATAVAPGADAGEGLVIPGRALLDIARDDYAGPSTA